MNNSKLALESISLSEDKVVDMTPILKEKEAQVIRTIEAVVELRQSAAWSTLKTEIFDTFSKNLRNEIFTEAKKDDPDKLKLRYLTGKLEWAERFSDLEKFEKVQRVELQRIRSQLGN